ncbi:hypothetical protein QCA50_004438 [Cerrena zonata]|uniref:Conidiation-specific protein 6 n=1 Tax=Cerrena zonata TaxID=2478898 RepID=A0AAW0GLV9_9APHY
MASGTLDDLLQATSAETSFQGKDQIRVAAGLKATINNPNVSEGAKENAAERLEHMGGAHTETGGNGGDHSNRSLAGYKATLSNQNTSEAAKAHAREVLEAAGYTMERAADVPEDEHEKRVLVGYKAALHNPRVSLEAKQHAEEFLQQHGAL